MRKAKSILSLLLAAVLTINTVPVSASAAGVKAAQNQPKTVAVPQTVMVQVDLPAESAVDDSEEMFRLYAEQAFAEAAGQEMIMPYGTTAGDYLGKDTTPKLVYEALKPLIKQVADGEIASTVFTLRSENGPCANMVWTKDDFGGQELYEINSNGQKQIKPDVINAIFGGENPKWKEKLELKAITNALLADCPKDLYWYDKTKGMSGGPASYDISSNFESIYVTALKFRFTPAVEYAVGDPSKYEEDSDYNVDTEQTGAVTQTIEKANAIVTDASGKSDEEKLQYYKDRIVALTSYNDAAASANNVAYGNPWQLIWVFDEDPDTEVVCEGYSKAFQFLCDLSTFTDEDFQCYSVTGYNGWSDDIAPENPGGAHMWNVVNLNGVNYLADITNCDEESVGSGADQPLFLKYVYASDTDGQIHEFDISGSKLHYTYFPEEKDLHCDGYLKLGPAPLEVDNTNPVSIPTSTVGTAIAEVDVSGKISGGKKPYTYAITEPADSWLKISQDGKITGTPTAVANASTITVTITDADGKTTTMTISVGEVTSAVQDLKWAGQLQTTATYGDANITKNTAINGTPGGSAIIYSSSNESVATVDANGVVKITGVGTTTITATVSATGNYNEASISYKLTVNPTEYIYYFPTELSVRKGSAVSAIGHEQVSYSEGLPATRVKGTLYWYKDAACTTPVEDSDLANAGTVSLYGKFVPDGKNPYFVTTPKMSENPISVQVMDVSFSVSQEETTDSATVHKMNTTYGNQWKNILGFYTGLKASYNGDDDTDFDHFDFLIGTERKPLSDIGETYPDAGTYQYDVVYNGTIKGETFTDVIVCSGSVTIAPKSLVADDLKFDGDREKTFDGTTKSTMTVSVKPSSLVKEEDSVTIQAEACYDNMNAGQEKKITFTVSETVTGNYALDKGTQFLVTGGIINPLSVTATRVDNEAITKEYDGNKNVTTDLKFSIPKAGTTDETITITTSGNTYAIADTGEGYVITLGTKNGT